MYEEMFKALQEAKIARAEAEAEQVARMVLAQNGIMSMALPRRDVVGALMGQGLRNNRRVTLGLVFYFFHTRDGPHWAKEVASFVPHLSLMKGNKRMDAGNVFMYLWKGFYEPPLVLAKWHDELLRDMKEAETGGNRLGDVYLPWGTLVPNPQGAYDFMWAFHEQVSNLLSAVPVSEGTASIDGNTTLKIITGLLG